MAKARIRQERLYGEVIVNRASRSAKESTAEPAGKSPLSTEISAMFSTSLFPEQRSEQAIAKILP